LMECQALVTDPARLPHPGAFLHSRPCPSVKAVVGGPVQSSSFVRKRGFKHASHSQFEYIGEVEEGVVKFDKHGVVMNLESMMGNWFEAGAECICWFTVEDVPKERNGTLATTFPYNGYGDTKGVAVHRDWVQKHIVAEDVLIALKDVTRYGEKQQAVSTAARDGADSCIKNAVLAWLDLGPHHDRAAREYVQSWSASMMFTLLPHHLQSVGSKTGTRHNMSVRKLSTEELELLGSKGVLPHWCKNNVVLAQPVYPDGYHGHCVLLRSDEGSLREYDPAVPDRGFVDWGHRGWDTVRSAYYPTKVIHPCSHHAVCREVFFPPTYRPCFVF
jgi:hypothetical protein